MRSGLAAFMLVAVMCSAALAYPEAPQPMSDKDVSAAVKSAPAVPVDLGLDLKLRLVDFIDCTRDDDPHGFMDQGTSKVASGPAGKYRVTAQHRHAWFAYRWHADKLDAPHLLVFEYPDDAKREICFFTHESKLSGGVNADWSLESGVYCGNPFPLSDKMQYHTFFFWPADTWPVAIVADFNRFGPPAACSRIWVFAIDGGLPAPQVELPEAGNQRMIGGLYNWSKVPVRGAFGLTSRTTVFDHIAEYYRYLGENVISWPVVSNNDWGFKCIIPAWDGGEQDDELEGILAACDRTGMKFIATFEMGFDFKMGGMTFSRGDRKAYAAEFLKGFEQFIEHYGKHPSLYGIAFGTPDFGPAYGQATLDILTGICEGDLEKFTTFIHKRKPDLRIFTFVGAQDLHRQWFEDVWDVVSRWERTDGSWPDFLAAEAHKLWKAWGRDPARLLGVKGLTVIHQYQPDDHGIYDCYGGSHQPRAMVYHDLDTSQAKSDMMNTGAAMLWNTFYEAHIGLYPGNFWYRKLWVAPDFNPAPPCAMAGQARALEHRDRDLMITGAWNNKPAGQEAAVRRFARAFRSLPPVGMADVALKGNSPVAVRSAVFKGKTYASVLNTVPFGAAVTVRLGDRTETVELAPYELKVITQDGSAEVGAEGRAPEAYVDWLRSRLAEFDGLIAAVSALDAEAVGPGFKAAGARAHKLMDQEQYRRMDLELGHGLTAELALRKRIMQPRELKVARVQAAPKIDGNLADWPAGPTEITLSDEHIGTHMYFPASWRGTKDLGVRLRLAHDGENLYVGIDVADDKIADRETVSNRPIDRDEVVVCLSKANYVAWRGKALPYEFSLGIAAPNDKAARSGTGPAGARYATAKTVEGYSVEVSIPLKELAANGGGSVGFALQVTDDDGTENIKRGSTWGRKTIMLFPNEPVHPYWEDARTCCRLLLE